MIPTQEPSYSLPKRHHRGEARGREGTMEEEGEEESVDIYQVSNSPTCIQDGISKHKL